MDEQQPWHRLFALSWVDFFRGTLVTVEAEKDLSLKKQLLDVLLLRKGDGPLNRRLPDGFEDFANYNLLTFKSHREKMSEWALKELLGHFVNLRKQVSPSMDEDELLPEEEFRLYAVCARFPQQLDDSFTSSLPVSVPSAGKAVAGTGGAANVPAAGYSKHARAVAAAASG